MKGTRLWQSAGSPLIQGKSRTVRPLWQPWIAAVVLAVVASNAITFSLYRTVLVEFFVGASALGALLGVWLARQLGWRAEWRLGLAVAIAADALFFLLASSWLTWALLPLGKVG